jgi:NAD(P)-dependent dehydrogenase (short-subunit alcohol dehydrogenase family)
MDLKGKTAIVTGSSRGIGKAVAKRFARDGANVAVNCVSTVDKAKAVVEEIRRAAARRSSRRPTSRRRPTPNA